MTYYRAAQRVPAAGLRFSAAFQAVMSDQLLAVDGRQLILHGAPLGQLPFHIL
jgi:hypothetical protein